MKLANECEAYQLPPSIPILEKAYSLEPDMMFGWVPKLKFKGPIPLYFNHSIIDNIAEEIIASSHYKLVYLGYRPNNSF